MSLQRVMVAFAEEHPTLDEWALAQRFLEEHPEQDLAPLLAQEFVRLWRVDTRSIERLLTRSRTAIVPLDSVRQHLDGIGGLSPLLHQPYRLGDGRQRRAGQMSIEEWEARRTMLLAQREGIDRAVAVCERVIAVLQRSGARCLDDLQGRKTAPRVQRRAA